MLINLERPKKEVAPREEKEEEDAEGEGCETELCKFYAIVLPMCGDGVKYQKYKPSLIVLMGFECPKNINMLVYFEDFE